jgi:hypothetical protein
LNGAEILYPVDKLSAWEMEPAIDNFGDDEHGTIDVSGKVNELNIIGEQQMLRVWQTCGLVGVNFINL